MQKGRYGFTLIELLVVIFIVAILIGLSIFGLQGARTASRDARRKADLEQIRSALEIFKADCGKYFIGGVLPSPLVGIAGAPYSSTCASSNTYLAAVPEDPISTQSYTYTSDGNIYILCAHLEQGTGAVSGCGSSCGSGTCNYQVTNP